MSYSQKGYTLRKQTAPGANESNKAEVKIVIKHTNGVLTVAKQEEAFALLCLLCIR